MVRDKCKRKYFHQCSRRHQQRIIQKDVEDISRQIVQYRYFNDNRIDTQNSSLAYVDKVVQVNNTNTELVTRNSEEDFDENLQISFEILEDYDKSNAQLLDHLNDSLDKYNKDYWEELLNNNDESRRYTYDYINVNNLSDADTQYDDEKDIEDIIPHFHNWALQNNISHKAINELLQLISKYIKISLLPKDARTVLHTARTINYINIAGGSYVHFGLSNVLNSIMETYTNAQITVNNIILSLNMTVYRYVNYHLIVFGPFWYLMKFLNLST